MYPQTKQWIRKVLNNEAGVTSVEYSIIFSTIAIIILLAGFQAIGPEISRHLGNAFEPNAGVLKPAE